MANLLKNQRELGFILKLDFKKAFDSVSWEFLFQEMKSLGFGEKWIDWIMSFFNSVRISVLVNGSPTAEISPSNGVRQEDPLSPLLFNLAGEVLSKMLTKENQLSLLKGVKLSSTSEELTHSQYADDTYCS